jgi:hypothetical protein
MCARNARHSRTACAPPPVCTQTCGAQRAQLAPRYQIDRWPEAHWFAKRFSGRRNGFIGSTLRTSQPAVFAISRDTGERRGPSRQSSSNGSAFPCLRSVYAKVSTPARYESSSRNVTIARRGLMATAVSCGAQKASKTLPPLPPAAGGRIAGSRGPAGCCMAGAALGVLRGDSCLAGTSRPAGCNRLSRHGWATGCTAFK